MDKIEDMIRYGSIVSQYNYPSEKYEDKLTEQAKELINKRYSQKDKNGNPLETWDCIVKRVVDKVIGNEYSTKTVEEVDKLKLEYYDI